MIIGPTNNGKLLAIVLAPKEEQGMYYPITAWPASGKLKRYYQQEHEDYK